MKEQTILKDATLDVTMSSADDAMRMARLLNRGERKRQQRRKLLAIFTTAAAFVRTLDVEDDRRKTDDGAHQPQGLTDSGGEDTCLSSFTH